MNPSQDNFPPPVGLTKAQVFQRGVNRALWIGSMHAIRVVLGALQVALGIWLWARFAR